MSGWRVKVESAAPGAIEARYRGTMKNRRLIYQTMLATLMAGMIASAAVHAEGDVKAGEIKAIPCMGCHGIPGYSNV